MEPHAEEILATTEMGEAIELLQGMGVRTDLTSFNATVVRLLDGPLSAQHVAEVQAQQALWMAWEGATPAERVAGAQLTEMLFDGVKTDHAELATWLHVDSTTSSTSSSSSGARGGGGGGFGGPGSPGVLRDGGFRDRGELQGNASHRAGGVKSGRVSDERDGKSNQRGSTSMEYLGLLRELGEINDFQSEHSAQAAAAGGDTWASSLLDVSQHVLAADRIVRAFTLPAAAFRTAVRQVSACGKAQKPCCCKYTVGSLRTPHPLTAYMPRATVSQWWTLVWACRERDMFAPPPRAILVAPKA